MDLESISNRILDSNFGLEEFEHSDSEYEDVVENNPNHDEDAANDDQTDSSLQENSDQIIQSDAHHDQIKMEVQAEESPPSEDDSELTHWGIKGMKWGVRRTPEQLGHKRKKKDRKYDDETNEEYQRRMERESRERQAKTEATARAKQQKREIKSQKEYQKRMLKSQEKQQRLQIKAQEKLRADQISEQRRREELQAKERKQQLRDQSKKKSKTDNLNKHPEKTMTDQELSDAINRLRKEKEYKDMVNQRGGILKKTVKGAAVLAGGILLQVGKSVAVKQLTKYANLKVDDELKKRGKWRPDNESKDSKDGGKKKKSNDDNVINVDDYEVYDDLRRLFK